MTALQQFPTPPPGYELVHRYAIVRLGPQINLYTESNHASLGITGIEVESPGGRLIVHSDFDPETELCLFAGANADATLASKGIVAGASGGGELTRFSIYSSRNLTYGNGSVRQAYTLLPANSAVFDSTVDNLWLSFASLKALSS